MHDLIHSGQVDPVRNRVADATQVLLGNTIMLSEAAWQQPSTLPGWTRAHVATHIARSADAMARLAAFAQDDHSVPLYDSDQERHDDLERGAERAGLELQIDLDTSAGALENAFSLVTDWLQPVTLPIGELPLASLTLARLNEVTLHHIDLNIGYTAEQVDPVSASWLLQWAAAWLRTKSGLPLVEIESDAGVTETVGTVGTLRRVTGPTPALWTWLTGRTDGSGLEGTDGLTWPLLG